MVRNLKYQFSFLCFNYTILTVVGLRMNTLVLPKEYSVGFFKVAYGIADDTIKHFGSVLILIYTFNISLQPCFGVFFQIGQVAFDNIL